MAAQFRKSTIVRSRTSAVVRSLAWSTANALAPTVSRSPATHRENGPVTILPPTDGGSFGDEAMVQGLVQHLRRPIVIVPYGEHGYGAQMNLAEAPSLGKPCSGLSHLAGLSRSAQFYAIGADVLDGKYSEARTLRRLALVDLAARAGVPTSIVGFSMNASPTPAVRKAWGELDERVRLISRDALSAERTATLVRRPVATAADLAFLISALRPPGWRGAPCEINVGFVPNSSFAKDFGGTADYLDHMVAALSGLLEADSRLGIVLLPHDKRGIASDFALIHALARRLPPERVAEASFVKTASHVRWVSSQIDALVSGRMHAAIGALGEGTPVAVLGYQDKAEGVLDMFEMREWVIDRNRALRSPPYFRKVVTSLLAHGSEFHSRIQRKLPNVVAAARRNVAQSSKEFEKDVP